MQAQDYSPSYNLPSYDLQTYDLPSYDLPSYDLQTYDFERASPEIFTDQDGNYLSYSKTHAALPQADPAIFIDPTIPATTGTNLGYDQSPNCLSPMRPPSISHHPSYEPHSNTFSGIPSSNFDAKSYQYSQPSMLSYPSRVNDSCNKTNSRLDPYSYREYTQSQGSIPGQTNSTFGKNFLSTTSVAGTQNFSRIELLSSGNLQSIGLRSPQNKQEAPTNVSGYDTKEGRSSFTSAMNMTNITDTKKSDGSTAIGLSNQLGQLSNENSNQVPAKNFLEQGNTANCHPKFQFSQNPRKRPILNRSDTIEEELMNRLGDEPYEKLPYELVGGQISDNSIMNFHPMKPGHAVSSGKIVSRCFQGRQNSGKRNSVCSDRGSGSEDEPALTASKRNIKRRASAFQAMAEGQRPSFLPDNETPELPIEYLEQVNFEASSSDDSDDDTTSINEETIFEKDEDEDNKDV